MPNREFEPRDQGGALQNIRHERIYAGLSRVVTQRFGELLNPITFEGLPVTIRVHTNDLPEWAIHERQLPHSYLDFLSEPIHEAPDGKGPVSLEEQYFRRQYEAGLKGNRKALSWLLKRITRECAAQLKASERNPQVDIRGIPRVQPLAPALAALGCITVTEPESNTNAPLQISFSPWFEESLAIHCRQDKLVLVKKWTADGGYQKPRVPGRDQND